METILDDDVLTEIHRVRRQHAEKFDFDVGQILSDMRKREQKRTEEGWPSIREEELPA